MAGYLATAEDWWDFEGAWNQFLKREQIPFYHAVESAHRKRGGPFEGWHQDRTNRVHREAVEIITKHRLLALGQAVHLPNFRAMYAAKVPDVRRHFPRPEYYTCFHWLLRMLGTIASTYKPPEQVSIVIEQVHEVAGQLVGMYQYALSSGELTHLHPYLAGPPMFRPKLGFPQLQAADVLAYEMRLAWARKLDPTNTHEPRKSWQALVRHATDRSWHGVPLLRYDESWEID